MQSEMTSRASGLGRARALVLGVVLGSSGAMAQEAAPAAPNAPVRVGDPEYGKSNRTLREADSPLRWIKLHSDTPRNAPPDSAASKDKEPSPVKPRPAVAAPVKPAPVKGAASTPSAAASQAAADTSASAASSPASASAADDKAPNLAFVERAEPAWDAATMTRLRFGRVEVAFDVGTDGRITGARVLTSSNKDLDKVALETIRKWRFEPISRPRSAAVEFGFDLDSGRDSAAPAKAPAPGSGELIAVEQPEPDWGDALMQKLRKGKAQIRINIGADGRLGKHEVLSASSPLLLDPIAAALKRWRFLPLEKPLSATVEFGFDLDRTGH